jgi:holliday junction DNA helicase RuvA
MFAYLEGILTYKSPSLLFLDVQGVAYEINISLQTYDKIQNAEKCRLFIHLQIKEDGWTLFGFADEDERSAFRLLLGVNGVGAATARIILSSLTIDELERAVNGEDFKTLEKIKGIGNKTAQRLLLELKGKLLGSSKPKAGTALGAAKHNTSQEDALIALMNLGINKAMAENAIKKVSDIATRTVEDIIKQALRNL